jgi:hypothetical protein
MILLHIFSRIPWDFLTEHHLMLVLIIVNSIGSLAQGGIPQVFLRIVVDQLLIRVFLIKICLFHCGVQRIFLSIETLIRCC